MKLGQNNDFTSMKLRRILTHCFSNDVYHNSFCIKKKWLAIFFFLLGFYRYLSLRMDGRVRGSGVGYPPWNAFVAQLPPVKGMWSGLLDGMDGRVL